MIKKIKAQNKKLIARKPKRKTKSKYNKIFIEVWKCRECDFQWSYKTVKCPVCSSGVTSKII